MKEQEKHLLQKSGANQEVLDVPFPTIDKILHPSKEGFQRTFPIGRISSQCI